MSNFLRNLRDFIQGHSKFKSKISKEMKEISEEIKNFSKISKNEIIQKNYDLSDLKYPEETEKHLIENLKLMFSDHFLISETINAISNLKSENKTIFKIFKKLKKNLEISKNIEKKDGEKIQKEEKLSVKKMINKSVFANISNDQKQVKLEKIYVDFINCEVEITPHKVSATIRGCSTNTCLALEGKNTFMVIQNGYGYTMIKGGSEYHSKQPEKCKIGLIFHQKFSSKKLKF